MPTGMQRALVAPPEVLLSGLGSLLDRSEGRDVARAAGDVLAFDAEDQPIQDDADSERQSHPRLFCAVEPTCPSTLATNGTELIDDIRNALNNAKLRATFLERQLDAARLDVEAIELLRVIGAEIDRIGELVSELHGAPKAEKAEKRAPLRALCKRAVELVTRPEQAFGAVSDARDLASCHVELVEQALLGLVETCAEAAMRGGAEVVLRARREPDRGLVELVHDGTALFVRNRTGPYDLATRRALESTVRVLSEQGGAIDTESRDGLTIFTVRMGVLPPAARAASGRF